MTCARQARAIGVVLLVAAAGLGTGEAMAIEESEYAVIERAGDLELRQYEPYIVAETQVEGDFEDVGNEGFRRLAGYIFGKNRSKASIGMTAPVNQEPASEKIDMTAPVGQEARDGEWRITFVMPAKYTMDTLPRPLDERVVLRAEPGGLVAAIRYSGSWSRKRYLEQEAKLRSLLEERGLEATGEPVFARYNSPFALWFLRRNEVLIPVARPQK
jgi:hypothetical protein